MSRIGEHNKENLHLMNYLIEMSIEVHDGGVFNWDLIYTFTLEIQSFKVIIVSDCQKLKKKFQLKRVG